MLRIHSCDVVHYKCHVVAIFFSLFSCIFGIFTSANTREKMSNIFRYLDVIYHGSRPDPKLVTGDFVTEVRLYAILFIVLLASLFAIMNVIREKTRTNRLQTLRTERVKMSAFRNRTEETYVCVSYRLCSKRFVLM